MVNVAKLYGLQLAKVDPQLIVEAIQKSNKIKEFGIRELERIIEDMLGESFLAARDAGAKKVALSIDDEGRMCVEPAE